MPFRDLIGPGRFIDPAVIQASGKSWSTRYPYAAWMPIPENTTQAGITPTQFIMHSMAGPKLTTLEALWFYINRPDITGESTFIDDMDGRMAQVVEANIRADNNYKANPRAVSIETQDRGYLEDPGIKNTPWTDPQMAQHAGLSAWLHLRFGIPLERCETWDGPGMDGHRAFPEWSVYTGKTCPGDARWAQIPDVLAAAREIVAWTPAPAPIPDPVPPTPIPVPPVSKERIVTPNDGIYIAAKLDTNGSFWLSDGTKRWHSDGKKRSQLRVAAGLVDLATGRSVHTWAEVSTVSQWSLDTYAGPWDNARTVYG